MQAVKKNLISHSRVLAQIKEGQQNQGLLVNLPKRYYELQRLHINENPFRNSYSGIQCTMFGGTSPLGSVFGSLLSSMGSPCVYPYRAMGSQWDNRFKELKPTADLGYKTYMRLNDFTSEKEIAFSLKDSNVVVSCIGSHIWTKKDKDFEDSNIRVPMAIAKAVKSNPKIKRFIYLSAAGADPNSHSRRLRTKWLGEQEVKEIYPNVTILRPTYIFNILHQNVTIAGKWGMQLKMFHQMNFGIEGMNSLCQPVFVSDVALAMLNCLKMEETIGQSYDLGGPNILRYEEMYEQFFNTSGVKPYTTLVKLEDAYEYYHYKWYQSFYRNIFRYWLNPEFMTTEAQDLVVNPKNKGFEDLYIKPVSFGKKVGEYVQDITWYHNIQEASKRENANN